MSVTMKLTKYLRSDKRRASFYYMVTGVFAIVLIIAAVIVFRAPSDPDVEESIDLSIGPKDASADLTGVKDENAQNEKGSSSEAKDQAESQAEMQEEIQQENDVSSSKEQETAQENPKDDSQAPVEDKVPDFEGGGEDGETDVAGDSSNNNPDVTKTEAPGNSDVGNSSTIPSSEDVTEQKNEGNADLAENLPTAQSTELTIENKEVPNTWATQANESKEEQKQEKVEESMPKEEQKQEKVEESMPKEELRTKEEGQVDIYDWQLCDVPNAADYIPCLDNKKALKKLKSTKHYEHRERHCPTGDDIPKCLPPLPEGYKVHVNWPQSRNQVWYANVPHPGLVSYKKDQNWVKKKDDLLIFPGGGTQFKQGAQRYIEFIQTALGEVAWGKHTRLVLDVGCGVASFGGHLFDKDVLTMSFAPKDEHEAQVQLALERGIPAILSVMGTKRLVFPSNSFDLLHCSRCRVSWHADGGLLMLELNRLLRPGGYFVWSATPVYKYEQDDIDIWRATKALTESMCWKLLLRKKDSRTGVGIAIFQKPTTNSCYFNRKNPTPPMCEASDNPDAAWYIPMQACLHKLPEEKDARATQWPIDWPARVNATPHWLNTIPKGIFGKPAAEEFIADTQHWQNVIDRSYSKGLEIDWSNIRNVMDMKAGYGGFAAALERYQVWVMNVVPVTEPDTLPIIFDRGLVGLYHDWCESFSTYPRTYDLLHADHLFTRISSKCSIVNTIIEMDRILRPEGWAIFRDTSLMLTQIQPIIKSLQWNIRISYVQDGEQLLAAQKTFWRPPAKL